MRRTIAPHPTRGVLVDLPHSAGPAAAAGVRQLAVPGGAGRRHRPDGLCGPRRPRRPPPPLRRLKTRRRPPSRVPRRRRLRRQRRVRPLPHHTTTFRWTQDSLEVGEGGCAGGVSGRTHPLPRPTAKGPTDRPSGSVRKKY